MIALANLTRENIRRGVDGESIIIQEYTPKLAVQVSAMRGNHTFGIGAPMLSDLYPP